MTTKYRLKIEEIDRGSFTHKKSMMFVTDDLDHALMKIDIALVHEIETYQKSFYDKIIATVKKRKYDEIVNSVHFDKASVGSDISNKEFIDNEYFSNF